MIQRRLAKEFGLKVSQVEATVALIDEGNTIPFVARYRKEATGGLDDVVLRDLSERLSYLRNLDLRKEEVLRKIDEQGKLTEELKEEIRAAEILQRIEDLYKPFRQKKSTRASKAREKGLEPLALLILPMDITTGTMEDVARPFVTTTLEEALDGAADIIAELIAEDPERVKMVREKTWAKGQMQAEAVDPEESSVYEHYYDYKEALTKIPDHRVLAIDRGEREKKLKVKVQAPAEEILEQLNREILTEEACIFFDLMHDTIEDAYKRLMAPSIEREVRRDLTGRAQKEAVIVFSKNTESLLMGAPIRGARILSIDPGYRTGCKVAVLDETGKLLAFTTIYPTEPRRDVHGSKKTLAALIEAHDVNLIAIGNGTGSRETEAVVAELIGELAREDLAYAIVNEAGASVYSASKVATQEHPDLDVTTRGALSIGRRLQDPLAELVKIDPKHIGVGQYQHDIDAKMLDHALTGVVENCVNRVGVDLNTASFSLLSYIAGINSTLAKNIVAYREEKGSFQSRKELKRVPKLGEKTFKQCAGFLRIDGGREPLDATGVHPESYAAAETLLEKLQIEKREIATGGVSSIEERIQQTPGGLNSLAEDLAVGHMTLRDIIGEIKKPGRDPREGSPPVVFRNDILTIDDLKPGMEISGTVRNLVDFGAFVDIGVKQDGLVHISKISKKFIRHPLDVLAIGQTVKVTVLSVDREKHKIGLSMLEE